MLSADLQPLFEQMEWADVATSAAVVSTPGTAGDAPLRQLDGKPPPPDFLAWAWLGRPAAASPERRR